MSFTDMPSTNGGAKNATTLTALADDIQCYAKTISTYLANNGHRQPSLDPAGPDDYGKLPEDIQEAQRKLAEASTAMTGLALGPRESVRRMAMGFHDFSTLIYISHYKIPEAVPLVGDISFQELAVATKTNERQLRRILRYAMQNSMFAEPTIGRVVHTPRSRLLVNSEQLSAVIEWSQMFWKAGLHLVPAIEKWGGDAQEQEQTPWSLAITGGKLSLWDYLASPENKHQELQFAALMKAFHTSHGAQLDPIVKGFDWASLGEGATVVDIGGNTGAVAYALAKAYPKLKLVVEDLPTVVATGRAELPPAFADRVSFLEYNILEKTQPVTDAAVYFMRSIVHDWPDTYAAKLIHNTTKIMKPGQRMIIMDTVVPSPNTTPRHHERWLRTMDMTMMLMHNALEREEEDWNALIKKADPRLVIERISTPDGGPQSLIEVVLRSDTA